MVVVVRAVLRLSSYRRLVAAYALNELAWSVATLALALVVYGRTGSAVGATVFFLSSQFVPALVSPALVARLDWLAARRVLPVLYALQALAFVALVRVTSHFALLPVLVFAGVGGTVALAARAIARATTAAVIAPRGLLKEGNAVANAVFAVCIMVGPLLGGLIVLVGGTSAALLANSGILAVVALMFATARDLPGPVTGRERAAGRVRAAVALASGDATIRALLGVQCAALVFFTMSIPVEVVFAQHSLRAGAGGYGALLSAWGAGAVAGSAAYVRWRRLPARALIVASSVVLGVGFLVMAVAASLWVAIVGSALGGVANGVEAVAVRTALQERVSQSWMAMILSLNESMFQALPGAGILLGGGIAALAGPRAAFAVAGAGALAIAALAPRVLAADDPASIARVSSNEPDQAIGS